MSDDAKKGDKPSAQIYRLTTVGPDRVLKDLGPNGGNNPGDAVQGNAFELEDWADVPGFEDLYSVSSSGRVYSHPRLVPGKPGQMRPAGGKFLVPGYDQRGYLLFRCYRGVNGSPTARGKTLRLHLLVAAAFIPNPEGLPEVNHKDGVKTNCAKNNLERMTSKENINHAIDMGLRTRTLNLKRFDKLSPGQRSEVVAMRDSGVSVKLIANHFGVHHSTIYNLLAGKTYKELAQ